MNRDAEWSGQGARLDRRGRLRLAITLLCAGLTFTLGEFRHAPSAAEAPEGAGGAAATVARRIRVPLPITGSSDLVIKQIIQRTLEQLPPSDDRPLILFEFSAPAGTEGSGSEFERSLSLARYLTSPALKRVRTAAYIPRIVTGHAVLPVLACEQIIMSPDAILGDAGKGETSIGPTMRGGYTEIARSRLTVPEAIALGMLDADLEVYRVTTGSGVIYTWKEELEELRKTRDDLLQIDTVIPAGRLGRFRGDELRQLGFVSYLVEDDRELASVLKVPADQLEFDPSLGGQWRAIRVELNGPVIAQSVERVIRTIDQQRNSRDINFLCLQIDSPGGSVLESVRLANYLSDLDDSRIRTVAYVPREARADAMIVAFACDHLVTHANAVLGGGGATRISRDELGALREPLERIARNKHRQWSLIMAMLDTDLTVYRYTQTGTDRVRYLSEEEFAELAQQSGQAAAAAAADAAGAEADGGNDEPAEPPPQAIRAEGDWIRGEPITTPGQVVQIDGQQAEALGVARFLVENFAEFQQLYQLTETPELIGPNWAFDLIDALASPQLGGILLFIGGFALIAELSSPGLGVGGFISAVCFLLYFWSNFLHGTAELLEVMLFVAGMAFVAIEIFVLPGFGVFGLGGGALMFAALVLASQTFVFPHNEYQWHQLSRSMLSVALAGTGVFASLLVLRRYMHRVPFFGRIMLMPPGGEDLGDLQRRESLVDYTHLVGQVGMTRTQLTPSGKATFGNLVVDVITDGEVVAKGSAVEVMEVHGSRVIVRWHEA